jgi:hypothetical protein
MRVKNALTDFRKTALDILYRDGVKITTIPVIRKESDWLARRIENIGSEQAAKIDDVTLWYMALELETIKTVGERQAPTVDALNIQTFSERKEIQQNTILKKPAWVENMIQNIEINMTKLSVADATVEQAVSRLLSAKIADGRASVYRLAGVAAEQHVKNVSWSAASIIMAGMFKAVQVQTTTVYKKQAIAAIDQNTTDCCLRVHGQIQPLDKPFILEGTPRYADKVDAPPFHWNAILAGEMCMTSNGEMPIENVRVGDMVLTHAGRFMPVTMALSRKNTGTVLEIETSGGVIRVTPEHPILTTAGWKNAEFLRQGDAILGCNKTQGLPTIGSNAGTLNANPQDRIPERAEIFVSRDIGVAAGMMSATVNLKANVQLWKEKVNDILTYWLLKFKVCVKRFEPIYKHLLDFCGICAVGICTTNCLALSNSGHMNGVFSFHSFRSNRIGDTNTRMCKTLPATGKGFLNISSFNTSLMQPALNNIAGNAKFISNRPFRDTGFVFAHNSADININSVRHNNLLPSTHYIINKIATLELQNVIVCDLSVDVDESYCIGGHYVHNCRSAMSLYTEKMEVKGVPTAEMEAAARAELEAREQTGVREEIWPASATSGRK